jgi:hypothetical protein
MPITQDRMRALIDAAQSCYDCHEAFTERVDDLIRDIAASRATPAEAWASICALRFALRIPPQAMLALGAERRHFTPGQMRENEKRARRMRARRTGDMSPSANYDSLSPEILHELERQAPAIERRSPPRPIPRHNIKPDRDLIDRHVEPTTDAIEPDVFDPAGLDTGQPGDAPDGEHQP